MRIRSGMAALAVMTAALATAGGAWATTDPLGTAVVAPNPQTQSPPVIQLQGSPSGITYMTQQPGQRDFTYTAYYKPYGSAATVVASPAPNPQNITAALSVTNGVRALAQTDPNDSTLLTGVTLQPLAGGAAVTIPVDESHERYIGSTGSGIVIQHFLQSGDFGVDIVLRRPGQADVVLDHLPNDTTVTGLVDQTGVFLQTDVGGSSLYYIDLASGTVTRVNTSSDDTSAALAFMSPTTLGWAGGLDHRTMVWMPRSGGAQTRLPVPASTPDATANWFAYDGTSVAFFQPSQQPWTMFTMPADGSAAPTTVALDVTSPHAVPVPGGGFLVPGRHSPTTFGIYQVGTGGQAALSQAIAPAQAIPVQAAMSSGRLIFTDNPTGDSTADLWSLQSTRSGSAVTLGTESHLAPDTYTPAVNASQYQVLVSGDRTAYVTNPASGRQITVLNGTAVERVVAYPTTVEALALSGNELLMHTIGTKSWWALNTTTGAQTAVTSPVAVLGGKYLTYATTTSGQLMRLDLTLPASATNPVQVRAASNCAMLNGNVLGFGNWVAYRCGPKNTLEALNVSTKKKVTLPAGTALDRLGDNVMLYDSLGTLYAMNLTSPTLQVTPIADLGALGGTTLPSLYALDGTGENAAWISADGKLHVGALPITASAPSLIDAQPDATLTLGGSWHDNADISKPVSWSLQFKLNGKAVRTITGTAPDGAVRALWNGRNSKNAVVAAGTYTWKLTATGLDGVGKVTQSGSLTAH